MPWLHEADRNAGPFFCFEVARALGVSVVTVERDWRRERAWLHGQLRDGVE